MKNFPLLLLLIPVFLATPVLRGQTDSPTGLAGSFSGSVQTGGGGFDPFERNAARSVTDLTVPGAVVPFTYTRTWNSRKGAASLGNGYNQNPWISNWCWTATSNESDELNGTSNPNDLFHGYYVAYPDGRVTQFNKPTTPLHSPPGGVGTYTPSGTGNYDKFAVVSTGIAKLTLTDGTIVNFTVSSDGEAVLATSVVDPFGRAVTLTGDFRSVLSTATEPGGRWIQMSAPVITNGGQTVSTTVTTSLGQSVSYLDSFPNTNTQAYLGTASSSSPNPSPTPDAYAHNASVDSVNVTSGTGTVTYNTVLDPATNQAVQAHYTYKLVQPAGNPNFPNNPPPPAFYRLVYADDPMFDGPLQRIKYLYVDNGPYSVGDVNMTAVLAEMSATSVTDPGTLVNYFEMLSNVPINGRLGDGFYTRLHTRGDGAARTLSWLNPTATYTYYVGYYEAHGHRERTAICRSFHGFHE